MQDCIVATEKEALYGDGKRLGIYRLGNGQILWMRRFTEPVQAAYLSNEAVYVVSGSARLHKLPRQPFDHSYSMLVPRAEYAAALRAAHKPFTLALLSSTGEVLFVAPPDSQVRRLAVSPHPVVRGCATDQGYIILSDKQGSVFVVQSQRVTGQWKGATGGLANLAPHPTQPLVAGAGIDGIVRVWEYPSGRLRAALAGHRWDVLDAAFAGQGDRLITIGSDGQALVWDWQTTQIPKSSLRLPAPPGQARLQREGSGKVWLLTSTHMYHLNLTSLQWDAVNLKNLSQKEDPS